MENHFGQVQSLISGKQFHFYHLNPHSHFTIRLASDNAYIIKVQTAGALNDRCSHVKVFRGGFLYKMHISVSSMNPYSEMELVQASMWGCLMVEVQSNVQITRLMHCSSWGTFKPVLRQVSVECVSDQKIKELWYRFNWGQDNTGQLDGLYLGQQYL